MNWVAYQSDETGRFEVYLASFPEPRKRIQITSGGGRIPRWGPDGHELFYVSPDYKLISVVLRMGPGGLEPSAPHELFSLLTSFEAATASWYAVAPDGKRILVNERQGTGQLELMLNWTALLKKR
jgi:Tol biopolymer transport system component